MTPALQQTLAHLLAGHRDYQREAHDAAITWARTSLDPCLITAATGAGKSHIVASVATQLHIMSQRPVLCLQPSGELTTQNARKLMQAFLSSGVSSPPVSVYSASAGQKSLRHPIVFATPGTAKSGLRVLREAGAIIVDEAHGITPSVRGIIDAITEHNPRVRVIGLTATPYRLDTGLIYATDANGMPVDASMTRDPYFVRMVAETGAQRLLDHPDGPYLTPPVIAPIGAEAYEIDGLVVRKKGFGVEIDKASEAKVFAGQGRKTAAIVADVVERTRHLHCGLIFAASIEHGREILASLPPGSAELVHGGMTRSERAQALRRLHEGRIKWIVNRDILTVGYDEPRIDHIVLMRHTESAGLLQQIIGRCLRLYPGKTAAYIYDYAGNIDKHFPGGRSIFDPRIKPIPAPSEGECIEITCPACHGAQSVKLNPAFEGADYDDAGYLTMLGTRVYADGGGLIPVHYARKCACLIRGADGRHYRCSHLFTGKPCLSCEHVNDIAARFCGACEAELVDPNDKLVLSGEHHIDPTTPRVTLAGYIRETLTHARSGDLYNVCTVNGVGDFWIPAENSVTHRWKHEIYRRWHMRAPEHDAILWRRTRDKSGTLSAFPELIRWGKAQTCAGCSGDKEIERWTLEGRKTTTCPTCAGTGLTMERW